MTNAAAAPVPRPSARVLLVDECDRVLLFSSRDHGVTRWYTVGGGVEPGESFEQAALREVAEETGLTGITLSREVWRGRPWTTTRGGVTHQVEQRYFLARVASARVDTSRLEDFERSMITGHRWWSVAELAVTTDLLRPAGLAQLLAILLADGPPASPVSVDG